MQRGARAAAECVDDAHGAGDADEVGGEVLRYETAGGTTFPVYRIDFAGTAGHTIAQWHVADIEAEVLPLAVRRLLCRLVSAHPAVFVNGTVGVGKTTAVDHVGDLLEEAGHPFTLVDLDALRRTWPPPEADPFHHALELANLEALLRNDLQPDDRTVVLAGVIEDASARRRYEQVLGRPLVVVRLAARPEVVRDRIDARYRDPAQHGHLEWHQRRAPELARTLEQAALDDHVLDVSDLFPRDVAIAVVGLASVCVRRHVRQ